MKIIKIDTYDSIHGKSVNVELEGRINGKYVRPLYRLKVLRDSANAAEMEKAYSLKVGDSFDVAEFPTAKEM